MGVIISPMSAKVIGIGVKKGDFVREGDDVAMIEAMKMEIPIIATLDGVVVSIEHDIDEEVKEGEALIVLE